MRRTYSYRNAVALLGGESALSGLLDKVSAIALLGTGSFDLLDARMEASRLADSFIRNLRDRVKGLARYDRTDRLIAAHGVVVVTSYFEALGDLNLRVARSLDERDRERLVNRDPIGHWVEQLIAAELPLPSPQNPHETLLVQIEEFYRRFSADLISLVSGLELWSRWNATERGLVRHELEKTLPAAARRRYEEYFRQLVADFPEVECWVNLSEHEATRQTVRRLQESLSGLQDRLVRIASGRTPSDRLDALIRESRAALSRKIVSADEVPEGLAIPMLGQAYVNPGFKLLPSGSGDRRPADESAWEEVARRDDLNDFLSGYLTLPQATQAPLLILGQPGAGKSVLTKMLAARLPPGDFLPLRVELRTVPADSEPLGQIEHAIRDALDETMPWPELVQVAQGALPVVMMDGFDELLQATGVSQNGYLEKIVDFQERQAERGRPVAVIVTSRTAVADRARVPKETPVLRLEPFSPEQVDHWTEIWNRCNERYFADHGLEPLSPDDVRAVPDLASQPLLLLMLALYDADANALRQAGGHLDEAELYERLLVSFAKREVQKGDKDLEDAELTRLIENELRKLAVTAFAMFNRGRQWVTQEDLNDDLNALKVVTPVAARETGDFRRSLSAAESVIGGFFFVHRAQALRDEQRLKTYEFLHATFGEYLVARLVARELAQFAEELEFARLRDRLDRRPDDAFLHALLSFAVLTTRTNIAPFLRYGIAKRVPADKRDLLLKYLCELFAGSLETRTGNTFGDYRPVHALAPRGYAVYSANLLLLCAVVADRPLTGNELFCTGDANKSHVRWNSCINLWESQFRDEEWISLTRTFTPGYPGDDETKLLTLSMDDVGRVRVRTLHPFLSRLLGEEKDVVIPVDAGGYSREVLFGLRASELNLLVALLPYLKYIDPGMVGGGFVFDSSSSRIEHTAKSLLELLLAPVEDVEERVQTYKDAFIFIEGRSERYGDLVLKQLGEDFDLLSGEDLLRVMAVAPVTEGFNRRQLHTLQRLLQRLVDRADVDPDRLREVHDRVTRAIRQEKLTPSTSEGVSFSAHPAVMIAWPKMRD
ncbi:hypothetical protein [Actinomadura sp. NBRC 104412]|uniref:NACHT domain-containing protein n=1 Tax=Actinomadura sp. NBRC 104412 TaxID=3032203 RepID=UPI0025567635|nr:hypothetical protein [Actinomadura sp. NBRC 104412]